jgi:hypothetical protein
MTVSDNTFSVQNQPGYLTVKDLVVNIYQPNKKQRDADIFPCAIQLILIYSVNGVCTCMHGHT